MNTAVNLQTVVAQLKAQLDQKDHQIQQKDDYIRQLEAALLQSQRKPFTPTSEKRSPDQLLLFNEAEAIEAGGTCAATDTVTITEHKRSCRPRVSLPDHLPREAVIHDLPEAEKVCPDHGIALKPIGSDDSEQLEYIPAQLKVLVHKRLKYTCPCCEGSVITAAKPKQPIEKGLAGPGLLAAIATQKRACEQYGIIRLGCWAHARRKFMDAQKVQPKGKTGKADQALALMQKLYRTEQAVKDLPPDQRREVRLTQAKPVIDKLHGWLQKSLPQVPPKTKLGIALGYLHEQWSRLVAYLDDGHYPIDNNLAENAIRPFAVGRKNWLFANSQAGARASANLYSLIETAKANNLNPYAYLRRVFTDLPQAQNVEDIEALMPWRVTLPAE